MPLTDWGCPECGGALHTDDLLEQECVTPGCGARLPDSFYRERDVNSFYIPEGVDA